MTVPDRERLIEEAAGLIREMSRYMRWTMPGQEPGCDSPTRSRLLRTAEIWRGGLAALPAEPEQERPWEEFVASTVDAFRAMGAARVALKSWATPRDRARAIELLDAALAADREPEPNTGSPPRQVTHAGLASVLDEYHAVNLREALKLIPDTGDWHGSLRAGCEIVLRDKPDARPNQTAEQMAKRVAALAAALEKAEPVLAALPAEPVRATDPVRAGLDFAELREANVSRTHRWHGEVDEWSLADWSNAMCGEAGEAANVVKKIRRRETGLAGQQAYNTPEWDALLGMLADELADVVCCADLLAQKADIDLAAAVVAKFNRVSEAQDFPERIGRAALAAAREPEPVEGVDEMPWDWKYTIIVYGVGESPLAEQLEDASDEARKAIDGATRSESELSLAVPVVGCDEHRPYPRPTCSACVNSPSARKPGT